MRRATAALLALALVGAWLLARPDGTAPTLPTPASAPAASADEPARLAGAAVGKHAADTASPGAVAEPRLRVVTAPGLPRGPLVSFLDAYRADVERGDAEAAFVLYRAFASCAQHEGDEQQARLRAQRARHYPDITVEERAAQVESAAAEFRATAEFCAGVPRPSQRDWWDWLERSAQLGNLAAIEDFINILPPVAQELRRGQATAAQQAEVERVFALQHMLAEEARESGSLGALAVLAGFADSGLSMQDRTAVPRDPVVAFAGFSVVVQMLESSGRPSGNYPEMVARLERELRPEQRIEADALIAAILRDPDCCVLIDPNW